MLKNAVWCLSNLCRGKNPPPDFTLVCACFHFIRINSIGIDDMINFISLTEIRLRVGIHCIYV